MNTMEEIAQRGEFELREREREMIVEEIDYFQLNYQPFRLHQRTVRTRTE